MQLNTKQVRAIVNNIAGFGAQYTDKTLEDKLSTRRSVIWCFRYTGDRDKAFKQVQETFAKLGATNTIKSTGEAVDAGTRRGGNYLRVIAQIG
jgi:hypothetical protein